MLDVTFATQVLYRSTLCFLAVAPFWLSACDAWSSSSGPNFQPVARSAFDVELDSGESLRLGPVTDSELSRRIHLFARDEFLPRGKELEFNFEAETEIPDVDASQGVLILFQDALRDHPPTEAMLVTADGRGRSLPWHNLEIHASRFRPANSPYTGSLSSIVEQGVLLDRTQYDWSEWLESSPGPVRLRYLGWAGAQAHSQGSVLADGAWDVPTVSAWVSQIPQEGSMLTLSTSLWEFERSLRRFRGFESCFRLGLMRELPDGSWIASGADAQWVARHLQLASTFQSIEYPFWVMGEVRVEFESVPSTGAHVWKESWKDHNGGVLMRTKLTLVPEPGADLGEEPDRVQEARGEAQMTIPGTTVVYRRTSWSMNVGGPGGVSPIFEVPAGVRVFDHRTGEDLRPEAGEVIDLRLPAKQSLVR